MSSHTIIEQSYQGKCHGTFTGRARYQKENLRGREKTSKRKYWRPEAIERYIKMKGCVGISYNEKCHSVYLHTKIDPNRWRNNINTIDENGKHSNRHKWHTLIIF